jgi:hypothetical protein
MRGDNIANAYSSSSSIVCIRGLFRFFDFPVGGAILTS